MPHFCKAIHFGESTTHDIPARVDLPGESKETVWYSSTDIQAMRDDAFETIQDVLNRQDRANKISFAAVLTRTYDACYLNKIPRSSDIKLLVNWSNICPERRGLERFLSAPHVADQIKYGRQHAIQSILEIQQQSLSMTPGDRASRLRKASLRLSLITKMYARVLGIVDAASAKEDRKRDYTTLSEGTVCKEGNLSPRKRVGIHSHSARAPPPSVTNL